MLVSLYTSRVNLNALGVTDFGIYGVVGGLVGMFWIVSTSMVGSINRFLTFEIGTGNQERLNKIFGTAMAFQYIISLIVLLLGETVGLWFLNHKMVIPLDRLDAANWVYQLSIFSFCMDLIVIPYTAAIVAHEKMSAFAYISIISALGKLVVAWTTMIAPFDKLIWFAAMILVNATILRFIYIRYCRKYFVECRSRFVFDKSIWKDMLGFSGWTFIGTTASILRDYGGNILINLFSGPTVNAARGIANQVNGAVAGFTDNFQMALKPQITKSYAVGNLDYMFKLICQGSRLSFYILFLIALPILLSTHYILQLWLGEVPAHTVLFVQLVLVLTMNESISGTLITAMQATGKIRNFQMIVGSLNLLNLPVSYIVLKFGAIPESVVMVAIGVSVCCTLARVIMLQNATGMSARRFVWMVYFNVIIVAAISSIIPMIVNYYMSECFWSFITVSVLSIASSIICMLYIGSNYDERKFIFTKTGIWVKSIYSSINWGIKSLKR